MFIYEDYEDLLYPYYTSRYWFIYLILFILISCPVIYLFNFLYWFMYRTSVRLHVVLYVLDIWYDIFTTKCKKKKKKEFSEKLEKNWYTYQIRYKKIYKSFYLFFLKILSWLSLLIYVLSLLKYPFLSYISFRFEFNEENKIDFYENIFFTCVLYFLIFYFFYIIFTIFLLKKPNFTWYNIYKSTPEFYTFLDLQISEKGSVEEAVNENYMNKDVNYFNIYMLKNLRGHKSALDYPNDGYNSMFSDEGMQQFIVPNNWLLVNQYENDVLVNNIFYKYRKVEQSFCSYCINPKNLYTYDDKWKYDKQSSCYANYYYEKNLLRFKYK